MTLSLRFAMFVGCLVFAVSCQQAAQADSAIPKNYKLIYQQDFETPQALHDFRFAYEKNWKLATHDGNTALEFAGKSKYNPPVRSPLNMALLVYRQFGDFILECDLKQTGKEYGHRDMCLFFNFTAPNKFYYSHIATKTDPHAHNIFIVNKKPRTKISTKTTKGFDWGKDQWHKVRLVRQVKTGLIEIYVNDMTKPVMTATDKTFKSGTIGFGSFDDTGMVDNIKVWAPKATSYNRQRINFPALDPQPKQPQPDITGKEFKPLFDGQTLDGWRVVNSTAKFTVKDNCIVGTCDPKARANTFLRTDKTFGDFVLSFQTKFDLPGNSGCMFRAAQRNGDGRVFGYQCEMDQSDRRWSGGLYDEARRGWLYPLLGDHNKKAREAFKLNDWNTFVIRCKGNRLQTWINGVPVTDFTDNDPDHATSKGFIALQVHTGKKGVIRWRDIKIKELK